MRFLGLLHKDGEPTLTLRSIHTSTEEEYKGILSGAIREAYGDVFAVVDPAEDSQERILNIFRRYTPASQRSRMVSFFLGMCREAGIPVLDVPRQRAMAAARGATPSIPRPAARGTAPRVKDKTRVIDTSGVPPALEGLVKSLPPQGTPLSAERRGQWLKMAEATLAFVYPEEKEDEIVVTEDEGDEEP
jgi:hypothetical protein